MQHLHSQILNSFVFHFIQHKFPPRTTSHFDQCCLLLQLQQCDDGGFHTPVVPLHLSGSASQNLTKHQLLVLCWHLINRMFINNVEADFAQVVCTVQHSLGQIPSFLVGLAELITKQYQYTFSLLLSIFHAIYLQETSVSPKLSRSSPAKARSCL